MANYLKEFLILAEKEDLFRREQRNKALALLTAQPDWLLVTARVVEQMNTLAARLQQLLIEGLTAEQARSAVGLEGFDIQASAYLDLLTDTRTLSAYIVILNGIAADELHRLARKVEFIPKPVGINEDFWQYSRDHFPDAVQRVYDPLGGEFIDFEFALHERIRNWTAKAYRRVADVHASGRASDSTGSPLTQAQQSAAAAKSDLAQLDKPGVQESDSFNSNGSTKRVDNLVEKVHALRDQGLPEKKRERDAELFKLHRLGLGSNVFSARVFQVYSAFLSSDVKERVHNYQEAARTKAGAEMFTQQYIDSFRDRVMADVQTAITEVEDYLNRVHLSYSARDKNWMRPAISGYANLHKGIYQVLQDETEAWPVREFTEPAISPKPDPHVPPPRKGDVALITGRALVSFRTAEDYLGITERQRQKLVKRGLLSVDGKGQNRKVTTISLRAYLPPEEIPN